MADGQARQEAAIRHETMNPGSPLVASARAPLPDDPALAGERAACAVVDDDVIRYASPRLRALLHWPAGDGAPRRLVDAVCDEDRARVAALLARADPAHEVCALVRADGTRFTAALECIPATLPADPRRVVVVTDLSDWMRDQAQLRRLAFRDALTGLANRALIYERLERAIAIAQRSAAAPILLLIDLDRFKPINDTLGHAAGDAALRESARRIAAATRAADTVGRLGGDEFVVLLAGAMPVDAVRVAARIIASFGTPVAGTDWRIGVSIGIAEYGRDGGSADQWLARADEAMYAAKAAGGNRAVFARDLGARDRGARAIVWTEADRIGIAPLDADHERLARAMNDLWTGLQTGASSATLAAGLRSVIEDLARHFAAEQAYMRAHPYPGAGEHFAEHARVLTFAGSLLAHADGQGVAPGIRWLADWLMRHVQTYDIELGGDRRS